MPSQPTSATKAKAAVPQLSIDEHELTWAINIPPGVPSLQLNGISMERDDSLRSAYSFSDVDGDTEDEAEVFFIDPFASDRWRAPTQACNVNYYASTAEHEADHLLRPFLPLESHWRARKENHATTETGAA